MIYYLQEYSTNPKTNIDNSLSSCQPGGVREELRRAEEALIVLARAADDWRNCFAKTSTIPAAMNQGVHSGHLALREPVVKPAGGGRFFFFRRFIGRVVELGRSEIPGSKRDQERAKRILL